MRHSVETITVNAGIPQRVVDTWLGRQSDRSTASVYYRLSDEESQEFMTKHRPINCCRMFNVVVTLRRDDYHSRHTYSSNDPKVPFGTGEPAVATATGMSPGTYMVIRAENTDLDKTGTTGGPIDLCLANDHPTWTGPFGFGLPVEALRSLAMQGSIKTKPARKPLFQKHLRAVFLFKRRARDSNPQSR